MKLADVNPNQIPLTPDEFQLAQRVPYSSQEVELTPEAGLFDLYRQVDTLITETGRTNTINGVPSVTTPEYFAYTRVTHMGTLTTYIRVSKPQKDGKGIGFPAFIESTSPIFEEIETLSGNFSTLFFTFDGTDGVKLCAVPSGQNEPAESRVNNPDDIALAANALNSLQVPQDKKTPYAEINQTKAGDQITLPEGADTFKSRWSRRRIVLASLGAIAGVGLITVLSVRGGSSAEPSNQNDTGNYASSNTLCNTNGVCVEGPGIPLESIPLAPGAVIARLPVDSTFAEAMSKIAIPASSTLNPNHIVRAQEGIYSYSYPQETAALPGEGDCTFIEGNFNQGISAAFTTSEDFAKQVRLRVDDESTLALCKAPGAPEEIQGKLYIARGTS